MSSSSLNIANRYSSKLQCSLPITVTTVVFKLVEQLLLAYAYSYVTSAHHLFPLAATGNEVSPENLD